MVIIDGVEFFIDKSRLSTIYQFLYSKGIIMPCFCYHEKLSIAGNCRMCLVEANNAIVVSCAMPLLDKMNVITKSQRLLHARENVLEFLLANHPLDCPICDQGGECDLQDISKSFGLDRGRFYELKRSVDNLNCFGPMIKTIMTRCIHCTRCVRFLSEYSDVEYLGIIDRGFLMKINTYVDQFIYDELCGNIIDLCPVGALTSMPYAFSARPWELKSIESIDILDSMAGSIKIDIVNNNIVRVLPALTEDLNEDWLTNKARYAFDVISSQRLNKPIIIIDNNIVFVNWIKALTFILLKLKLVDNFSLHVNNYLDIETGLAMKNFFNSIGVNNFYYENVNFINDYRHFYLLNTRISNLENVSLILLVDLNLRLENPLLNSRLRKNYNKNKKLLVYSIGQSINYTTFPIINLGNSNYVIYNLCQWKLHKFQQFTFSGFSSLYNFNIFLPNKITPIILLSSNLFRRMDGISFYNIISKFSLFIENMFNIKYTVLNVVNNYLGKITYNELSLNSNNIINSYYNNLDYYINSEPINNNGFVIYQGPFFLFNKLIDIFLPTATYFERNNTYFNVEGRARTTQIALSSEKFVLTDFEIFRLMHIIRKKLVIDNFSMLLNFYKTFDFNIINNNLWYDICVFSNINKFMQSFEMYSGFSLRSLNNINLDSFDIKFNKNLEYIFKYGLINSTLFSRDINNYYNSDSFVKLSKLMTLCASRVIISHFSKKLFN